MSQQRKHSSKGKMVTSQEHSNRKQSKAEVAPKEKSHIASDSLTSMTKSIILVIVSLLLLGLALGCAFLESVNAKEKIAAALVSASETDGIVAVSNRIERLVSDGTLSRKQADRLHEISRNAFDQLIERMKEDFLKEEL